jgi:hypothetical protein
MHNVTPLTNENLGHYVYTLIDPRSKKVFYVGKGSGSRIYAHVAGQISGKVRLTPKNLIIKEILDSGLQVSHEVVRHGLTEDQALLVEATLIDVYGRENLTNEVDGHHTDIYGKRTIEELELQYGAKELVPKHNLLLIRINRAYKRGMGEKALYEATRKHWKIGKRAESFPYVCCVYDGIVREVYEVKEWYDSVEVPGRREFTGKKAVPEIRDHYYHTSVKHLMKQGAQSPYLYVMAQ